MATHPSWVLNTLFFATFPGLSSHATMLSLRAAYARPGAVGAMILQPRVGGGLAVWIAVLMFDAGSGRWRTVTPPCLAPVGTVSAGTGTVTVVGDDTFCDLRVEATVGSIGKPIGGIYSGPIC